MPSALRASARPAFCAGPPPFSTSTALVRSLFRAPPYPYSAEPMRLASFFFFFYAVVASIFVVAPAFSFILLIIIFFFIFA